MNKLHLLLVGPCLLASCAPSLQKLPIDPGVIQSSVEIQSPATTERSSQAVYVPDEKIVGWMNATTTPNGDLQGGQYIGLTVREGFWSNQAEAEWSGRPFTTPNSSPLIPVANSARAGMTGGGQSEVDLGALNEEITQLRQEVRQYRRTAPDNSLLSQAATGFNEDASREIPAILGATLRTMKLQRKAPGTVETFPVEGFNPLEVSHYENGLVTLRWNGRVWQGQFGKDKRLVLE